MSRPNCFIVTVGTSLISEGHLLSRANVSEYSSPLSGEYLSAQNADVFSIPCLPTEIPIKREILKSAKGIAEGHLDKENGAELCALFSSPPEKPDEKSPVWPKPFDNLNDFVYLFATRTRQGAYCAEALRLILVEIAKKKAIENPEERIKLCFPKCLGLPVDGSFALKGLNNLLDDCFNVVDFYTGTHTVIIVPNGGYKAFIPYLSMIGMMCGFDVRYVYEETNVPVNLARVPLGPNSDLFSTHQIQIEGLLGQSWHEQAIARFPVELRSLFDSADGKIDFTPLGRLMWGAFQRQVGMTPLSRATANKALLDRLGDDLRTKFLTISRLDGLIWKGDRVPEMVEHATRHHTNLFTLAHRVLDPCFQWLGDQFLSQEELFILLCSLILHDCGHVKGNVEWPEWNNSRAESLFPGEIREFHNILGYIRLEKAFSPGHDTDPLCREIVGDPAWSLPAGHSLWDNYLKAGAVAGLFHRQAMPLFVEDSGYTDCGFFKPVDPIEKWPVRIGSKPIETERMRLIVALLRLIDSLDTQGSRTGGESFVRFHRHFLQAEIDELSSRIEEFTQRRALSKNLADRISCYCDCESQVIKETVRDRQFLGKMIGENQQHQYLVRHFMEMLLTRRFKQIQAEHFAKHLPVTHVKIDPLFWDNNETKKIRLAINVEIDPALVQGDKGPEAARRHVVTEMEKEKTGIGGILDAAGVELVYLIETDSQPANAGEKSAASR